MELSLYGVTQTLDGLRCVDCTFTDVELEYSGGQWDLVRAVFSGKRRIVFKGAAENTIRTLGLMDKLSGHELMPIPNAPIPPKEREKFEISDPMTITMSTPSIK